MDSWKFLLLSTFQSPTLFCSALYADIFSCKSEDLGEMELLCLCENWSHVTFTLMRAVMPPLWLPLQALTLEWQETAVTERILGKVESRGPGLLPLLCQWGWHLIIRLVSSLVNHMTVDSFCIESKHLNEVIVTMRLFISKISQNVMGPTRTFSETGKEYPPLEYYLRWHREKKLYYNWAVSYNTLHHIQHVSYKLVKYSSELGKKTRAKKLVSKPS